MLAALAVWCWTTQRPERPNAPASSPSESERSEAGRREEHLARRRGGLCDHPFVPSHIGAARTYELAATGARVRVAMRVTGAGERDDGTVVVRWQARLERRMFDIDVTCRPGIDAAEPWFALLTQSFAQMDEDSAESRWRWPTRLEPRVTFGGAAHLRGRASPADAPALEVRRTHEVEAVETITVRAGTWRAWRVGFAEEQVYGDATSTSRGEAWVAEGAGVLRETIAGAEHTTMELVAAHD